MTTRSRPRNRRCAWWVAILLLALIGCACWWLTEPLEKPGASTRREVARPALISETPTANPAPPPWPAGKLEGMAAKRLLLASLEAARRRLDAVDGYTATFRRQERLRGKLGPQQTLRMKARPNPFAIYLKVEAPKAGKEIVFARGKHDDKLIAHNGDWKDKLIPRLKLDPTGTIALADSRHPITEAGLVNLTDRLVNYRRLDMKEQGAVTVLDRHREPDGREWLRSVHTHADPASGRPFARVEVLYDPETRLPLQISSYDWPETGQSPAELLLAERYRYDDLDLDALLSDLDFDPANPSYAFSRF